MKVLYVEAPPRGPTPHDFVYHLTFDRKGTYLCTPSIEKWYPFKIHFNNNNNNNNSIIIIIIINARTGSPLLVSSV